MSGMNEIVFMVMMIMMAVLVIEITVIGMMRSSFKLFLHKRFLELDSSRKLKNYLNC